MSQPAQPARVPLRIALLSAEYPPQPGGIGDYTRRLGVSLAERGHTVLVFTIQDARFQIIDLSRPSALPAYRPILPRANISWGWRSWRALIAALEQTQPDVLHTQYQTGAYGMRPAINLLPWRLRRRARRPALVVTAHDLLPPYLFPKAGRLREWVTQRLLADSDAAVVTNDADYARARAARHRGLAPQIIPIGSNIAVAPPAGYSRATWRAQLQIAKDEVLLAFFGLISRSKGVDTLLDALADLPQQFQLLVIGGTASSPEDRAYAEAVRRQIAKLGLERRVRITGHCAEAEVSAHLLAADMAVLPFSDGASFRRGSLLAALAHGLPVITTLPPAAQRSSIAGARLLSEQQVLLAPPADPAALGAAITRLASDAALRGRLAVGGQALAAQFGWPAIAAQHEQLYTTLTRGTS